MKIKTNYIKPKFKKESNPKVGQLALSTDLTIEKAQSTGIPDFFNR